MPVPADGIALENALDLIDCLGSDSMLLICVGLQVDRDAIEERSRSFAKTVRSCAR